MRPDSRPSEAVKSPLRPPTGPPVGQGSPTAFAKCLKENLRHEWRARSCKPATFKLDRLWGRVRPGQPWTIGPPRVTCLDLYRHRLCHLGLSRFICGRYGRSPAARRDFTEGRGSWQCVEMASGRARRQARTARPPIFPEKQPLGVPIFWPGLPWSRAWFNFLGCPGARPLAVSTPADKLPPVAGNTFPRLSLVRSNHELCPMITYFLLAKLRFKSVVY